MDEFELRKLIFRGENFEVEFKGRGVHTGRDRHADSIAKEMSAFLNFEGGQILLGVEDDGTITGLNRTPKEAEEWVMNIARNNLQPQIIPTWHSIRVEGEKYVGVIHLPDDSPEKPYKARRGNSWVTYIRVGSTSREATREEEGRLFQASQILHYDLKPVRGVGLESLDLARIKNYFEVIRDHPSPDITDETSWIRILPNMGFLVDEGANISSTVASLLLFGRNPNRQLPQAGITATVFFGTEKDYNIIDRESIRGPLVSVRGSDRVILEKGVIDRAQDFVIRNMGTEGYLDSACRMRRDALPEDAIRESIVNAVAHRDYMFAGTDIELSLYKDRLEIISPGKLPNGVTVENIKYGRRVSRNVFLTEILKDYGYIEHLGMGVPNKIIRSMQEHNGTEPDLIEDDDRFTVRLWKNSPSRDDQGIDP